MRRVFVAVAAAVLSGAFALPAAADHTNPNQPLAPIAPPLPGTGILAQGEGEWDFITNIPPNLGTDLKFFMKNGDLYAASGTLGQGPAGFVGQRFIKLIDDQTGDVAPTWVADHGSAACEINTAVTGLQHDQAVTPAVDPLLLADTTDATGRCHDTPGGGLELVDISGLGRQNFTVREVGLIRHHGFSHTVTADPNRPGIFYNSTSDARTPNLWIDIVDARSCMFADPSLPLKIKRNRCKPAVYRLSWENHPEWTERDPDGEENPRPNEPGSQAACHDITVAGNLLYCASLQATLYFDIAGMFDENGNINGERLRCGRIPGTRTGALVTNCARFGPSTPQNPVPHVTGWQFLGNYNHPGRVPGPSVTANLNMEVPSSEGVSVSHESDPTPDGDFLMVTDERGGGIVPPGASCTPGIDNPYGNGGLHIFDLNQRVPDLNNTAQTPQPPYFPYAREADGSKAIWRGDVTVPAATFCTIHVIDHVPDEARIFMGYYSQGIKVLDYFIDRNNRWSFRETASLTLEGDNDWVAEPFKIVDNRDGTRTYWIMASDIQRGIDIVTWTGPKNPLPKAGLVPGTATRKLAVGDLTLLVLGVVGLPLAARFGRRRRRAG